MMHAEQVVGDPVVDLKEKEGEACSKSNNPLNIDIDWLKDTMVTSSTIAQLETSQHAFVSAEAFWSFAKGAEIYVLEISKLKDGIPNSGGTSIPEGYSDLQGAFSEKASNKLPEHGVVLL